MEQVLAEAYGLVDAVLAPVNRGAVNQNYRVDAGGAAYVLKAYDPKLYPLEQLERSLAAQALLLSAGIPVAGVVSNRDGAPVTAWAGRFYTLSHFVSGRHHDRPHVPPRAAHAMGRVLGQMMNCLASLPTVAYTVPDPADLAERFEGLLRAAERRTGSLDEVARQVLRHKLGALDRLAPLVRRFGQLKPQWLHGDYQDTNVIFTDDDEVAAVIDFDNLRCRPRANEVMRCFDYAFPDRSASAYEFFAGYAETADGLTEAEVALYVPYRTYMDLVHDWPIYTRYMEPELYQERWDRFITPPSGWWEQNGSFVAERLLQLYRRTR